MNLKKAKFELRMRKKTAFQYKYYILAVADITVSCFGSSSRVSTYGIAANYVLFKYLSFQGLLKIFLLCV